MNQIPQLIQQPQIVIFDGPVFQDQTELYNQRKNSISNKNQNEEIFLPFNNDEQFQFINLPEFVQMGLKAPSFQFNFSKTILQTCSKEKQQIEQFTIETIDFKQNFMNEEKLLMQTKLISRKQVQKLFKQKKLKGGFKKNTNVPKLLVRIFMKHFKDYLDDNHREKLLEHYNKIKQLFELKISNNYTISDVLILFRGQDNQKDETRKVCQQIMSEIIQDNLNEEVIGNKCLRRNQISYLIAAKIYNLRCRSKTLTERVKIF